MAETTVTTYIVYEDGTTERQQYTGDPDAPPSLLSRPGRFVTEDEYEAALERVAAFNRGYEDELNRQQADTLKGDYDALIRAGIPDSGARRMSGYTGS